MSSESIIVYRSRAEQMRDEFWWGIVEDHPEFFAWAFEFFFGAILFFIIGIVIYTFASALKPHHRR